MAISEETHHHVFHSLLSLDCHICILDLFASHRQLRNQYKEHQSEFNDGGLHGAGFSTNATNVIIWCCSHNSKQAHIGFKSTHSARTSCTISLTITSIKFFIQQRDIHLAGTTKRLRGWMNFYFNLGRQNSPRRLVLSLFVVRIRRRPY